MSAGKFVWVPVEVNAGMIDSSMIRVNLTKRCGPGTLNVLAARGWDQMIAARPALSDLPREELPALRDYLLAEAAKCDAELGKVLRCNHPRQKTQQTGDGMDVLYCPDCGSNRLADLPPRADDLDAAATDRAEQMAVTRMGLDDE